jgi:hypothetical protein
METPEFLTPDSKHESLSNSQVKVIKRLSTKSNK